MRGRRRRNKSSPQDDHEHPAEAEAEVAPSADGTVKLVETSPPTVHADAPSGAGTGPGSAGPMSPMKKTSSDVATAHAELDSVLPPQVTIPPQSGAALRSPAAPQVSDTGSSAPLAVAQRVTGSITVDAPTALETDPPGTRPEVGDGSAEAVVDGPAEGETPAPVAESQAASGNPLPRVLAVANQKGGVGKTTTSVNLGAALAELGFRVLVIDLDPQGNATTGLGVDARNFELSMYDVMMRDASLEDCVEPTSMKNLFVAPATIALAGAEIELVPAFSRELKLKRSIESVIDDFDYVLIDCPPSLGLITVNALAAADEVLVPIQCEYYALEGLSQLMRNVHLVASNLNPKLDISTIVLTMYDARTKLADQVANEVRQHFGSKVCRSVIPRTVRLSEAPSFGQPITAFDPTSRGAIAYRELAKEVSGGTS
jgi:chromosome partitioning protein